MMIYLNYRSEGSCCAYVAFVDNPSMGCAMGRMIYHSFTGRKGLDVQNVAFIDNLGMVSVVGMIIPLNFTVGGVSCTFYFDKKPRQYFC